MLKKNSGSIKYETFNFSFSWKCFLTMTARLDFQVLFYFVMLDIIRCMCPYAPDKILYSMFLPLIKKALMGEHRVDNKPSVSLL